MCYEPFLPLCAKQLLTKLWVWFPMWQKFFSVTFILKNIIFIPGILPDQNKWCTAYFWNFAYWQSNNLLFWDSSYPFNIRASGVKRIKLNWEMWYIEEFIMINICFSINWSSSNITLLVLQGWKIYFCHLLNYELFSVQSSCQL